VRILSFKICVIGCGEHASKVHGPSYKKYAQVMKDTVLAGCCDLNEANALKFKEKFGFRKSYNDFRIMLKAEKPDAVCIIVPEKAVCQVSIAVMEMGYPVLIEKPPGLNKSETLRMAAAAAKAGVINQVAFNRRYLPLINKLKEEISYHIDGTPQSIFYEFYRNRRAEDNFETTAIHGIDAVKHIAGSDYKEIKFAYQELGYLGKNVANIFLDCIFENGIHARLNFCPCAGVILERAVVNAYDHTFFLNTPIWDGFDTPGKLVHVKDGKLQEEILGSQLGGGEEMFETNGFYSENYTFFNNVKKVIINVDSIESCLQVVEIAECIENRLSEYHKEENNGKNMSRC